MTLDPDDIERLRGEIDRIDLEILDRLARRGECAIQIGSAKRRGGLPATDLVREADIMRRLEAFSLGRFDTAGVKRVYGEITQLMKWLQQSTPSIVAELLARTVPSYESMRKAVFDVGSRFARPGTSIIDLGCSRGDSLVPFVMQLGSGYRFVGIEVSPPLVAGARERFRGEIEQGWVEIRELDLRTTYPREPASVTLAILSLQFLPIECRQQVLLDAYDNTVDGGVVIVVERIMGASAELDLSFAAEYSKSMTAHGFPAEEVERKRLMLEGILVPLTAPWNEEMLVDAGFAEVDCFWRWMNFAGWIARKPPGGRYGRPV